MPFTLEEVDYWRNHPTGKDLLRMIMHAEGTKNYGGDPYRTLFGGGQFKGSFDTHPDILVNKYCYETTAAGPYQMITTTWNEAKDALGLPDFSPLSQDRAAIYLAARKLRQYDQSFPELQAGGMTPLIMENLADTWASLPNRQGKSWYNQPVKPYDELLGVYNQRSLDEAKKAEAVNLSESWLQKLNPFRKKEAAFPGSLPPIPDNIRSYGGNYE